MKYQRRCRPWDGTMIHDSYICKGLSEPSPCVSLQELAGGMNPSEYLEIIDCNPVSPDRLNVPLNAFTHCTSQVG